MRKTTVKRYTQTEVAGMVRDLEHLKNGKKLSPVHPNDTTTQETTYKIEHNVPIPHYTKAFKYPLLDMDINDSFVVSLHEIKMVRSAINRTHRSTDFRFITRTVIGRGRAGKQLRVWRTS